MWTEPIDWFIDSQRAPDCVTVMENLVTVKNAIESYGDSTPIENLMIHFGGEVFQLASEQSYRLVQLTCTRAD